MPDIQTENQKLDFSSIDELAHFIEKRPDLHSKIQVRVNHKVDGGVEETFIFNVDLTSQDFVSGFSAALAKIQGDIENRSKVYKLDI